jgi:hypothetical protein
MQKRRKRHAMPDDVREALLKARLWDTYRARPSYQQNDYIGWIVQGVRAETREKRIAQMLDELKRGNVYMKMAWGESAPKKSTPARSRKTYEIKKANVWIYPGAASWHFVTLPEKEARDIKNTFKGNSRAWGSIPVTVTLGTTTWKTSIFPDGKTDSYLLPLKAQVRKKEGVPKDGKISFRIVIG